MDILYKKGPHLELADPLSRMNLNGDKFEAMHLPLLLERLLKQLPDSIKDARNIRVNADRDTPLVARVVQRWRTPTNPIELTVGNDSTYDFLITATSVDKQPLKVAAMIRANKPFAALMPLAAINEIEKTALIRKYRQPAYKCPRSSQQL